MHGLLTDEFEIAACLERHAASVRETSPGVWEFSLAGRDGTARLEPEWLLLDVPLERLRSKAALSGRTLAEMLELAGRIDGLAKFGFDPGTKRLHLQAEIPLVLEDDPMERIDLAFVSMEQALQQIGELKHAATGNRPDANSPLEDHAAATATEQELNERCSRWKEFCDESSWPVHQRGASRLAVSLDVPGSFCQAIVEAAGPGRLRIRHEAGKSELSDVSRRGLAVFLLTASRVVRMARAYEEFKVTSDECRVPGKDDLESNSDANSSPITHHSSHITPAFGWEIVLHDPPALFVFDRALSALSMACRMSTNELAVLTDDEVSRRYLAVQGMVP